MKISNLISGFWIVAATFGISGMASAACDVSIVANDAMQFNVNHLEVDASCKEIKVTLKHSGKMPKNAMGHNWVLTGEQDMNALLSNAAKAGVAKDYLPDDKSAIIAHTKLLGGGESDTVTFSAAKLKKGQKYVYFCSFPGHAALMKGTFEVK